MLSLFNEDYSGNLTTKNIFRLYFDESIMKSGGGKKVDYSNLFGFRNKNRTKYSITADLLMVKKHS